MTQNIYQFSPSTIDGKSKPLADYKGEVLLIVNTASECGFTPQYESLEKLYEQYKDKGFRILGFPANDFGAQEPGTNAEIAQFCDSKFHVKFDMFEKITVKGESMHPLYKYLTKDSPFPGDVKWNFQKYLVDRSGNVVAKYMSKVDPLEPEVTKKVEELLAKK